MLLGILFDLTVLIPLRVPHDESPRIPLERVIWVRTTSPITNEATGFVSGLGFGCNFSQSVVPATGVGNRR